MQCDRTERWRCHIRLIFGSEGIIMEAKPVGCQLERNTPQQNEILAERPSVGAALLSLVYPDREKTGLLSGTALSFRYHLLSARGELKQSRSPDQERLEPQSFLQRSLAHGLAARSYLVQKFGLSKLEDFMDQSSGLYFEAIHRYGSLSVYREDPLLLRLLQAEKLALDTMPQIKKGPPDVVKGALNFVETAIRGPRSSRRPSLTHNALIREVFNLVSDLDMRVLNSSGRQQAGQGSTMEYCRELEDRINNLFEASKHLWDDWKK